MPTALLVGRFQPFHNGHLHAAREIAANCQLVICIGSAQYHHTKRNPFTAHERKQMIEASLKDAGISNFTIIPVTDLHAPHLWASHMLDMLPKFDSVHSNDPVTVEAFKAAGVRVEPIPNLDRDNFQGTNIRKLMAKGGDWKALVPEATVRILDKIEGQKRVARLFQEA